MSRFMNKDLFQLRVQGRGRPKGSDHTHHVEYF